MPPIVSSETSFILDCLQTLRTVASQGFAIYVAALGHFIIVP